MKRIALKLVLFLLLGAVVNVAVAWGCAVYIDLWTLEPERSSGYHATQDRTLGESFDTRGAVQPERIAAAMSVG